MRRIGCIAVALVAAILIAAGVWFAGGWYGGAEVEEDSPFVIPSGSSLTSVARKLEEEGHIG